MQNHEIIYSDHFTINLRYFVDDSAFTFRILLLNPRLSPRVNVSRTFGRVFVKKVVYYDKTWRFLSFSSGKPVSSGKPAIPRG